MPSKLRAREFGLPFRGTPGKNNTITDVAGVEVGYSTIIMGEPEDYVADESDFARTGVTAILPRGKTRTTVVAATHSFNGFGELTGAHNIADFGVLDGPIMLTNTFSVGTVRDAAFKWFMERDLITPMSLLGEPVEGATLIYPVVGETYDGFINNARGFHVKPSHAIEAIESAAVGPIAEGNVGGGTGMQCHLFKGGSGTASRKIAADDGGFTLGVFVQANHGYRERFQFRGIPLGTMITGADPVLNGVAPGGGLNPKPGTGSIIVVIATDAPVSARQLDLICRRAPLGVGLLGGGTDYGSGDIVLGFSTAHSSEALTDPMPVASRDCLSPYALDGLFAAAVDATEEAILNALAAAETMTGINGNTLCALPLDQVCEIINEFQHHLSNSKQE